MFAADGSTTSSEARLVEGAHSNPVELGGAWRAALGTVDPVPAPSRTGVGLGAVERALIGPRSWALLSRAANAVDDRAAAAALGAVRARVVAQSLRDLDATSAELVHELLLPAGLRLVVDDHPGASGVVLRDRNGHVVPPSQLGGGERDAIGLLPAVLAHGAVHPCSFLVLDEPCASLDRGRLTTFVDVVEQLATRRRVVVLTGQDDLADEVAARSGSIDVRELTAAGRSTVEFVAVRSVWRLLLDDAQRVIDQHGTGRLDADAVAAVHALCRRALDDALRELAMQRSVTRPGLDGPDLLTVLDGRGGVEVRTTAQRLTVAAAMLDAGDAGRIDVARDLVEPYLSAWVDPVVAAAPVPDARTLSASEVVVTRAACTLLLEAR